MRLLLYTLEFPPFAGGAGVYTAGLAKGLAKLGHDVTVLAPAYKENSAEWDAKQPYRIIRIRLPESKWKVLVGAFQLLRVWACLLPDVVFVTESGAQRSAALALLFPIRVRYCVTVHGSEIEWYLHSKQQDSLLRRISKRLIVRLFLRAHAIVCVSHFTRKALLQALPNLESRTVVVYNGVDLDQWVPVSTEQILNRRRELTLEGPVLLTVARLIPEKGIDTVIEALGRIVADIPTVKYVVVGIGPDRERLEKLVAKLSLQNSVIFTGKISNDDLKVFYSLCDVFVMVSRPGTRIEGFGLVYAEAGAYGKPVIAGRTGGVPEAVRDGYNGILVDPYSIDEVERAIRTLLSNPSLAQEMGRNGRKLVEEKFNIDRMAIETLCVACGDTKRPHKKSTFRS